MFSLVRCEFVGTKMTYYLPGAMLSCVYFIHLRLNVSITSVVCVWSQQSVGESHRQSSI